MPFQSYQTSTDLKTTAARFGIDKSRKVKKIFYKGKDDQIRRLGGGGADKYGRINEILARATNLNSESNDYH